MAAGHRARDVEREQQPLARRLDVAERRVERGVERVDDLAAPGSTRRGRARRDRTRTSGAPRAPRSGAPVPGGCARASPSCATTLRRAVRARREQADPRHRREVADQRRHRHVLEQRLPDLGRRRGAPAGAPRAAGRYSRTSAAVSRGVAAACARTKPSTMRGRPSVVAAADDPLEQASVLVARPSSCRVARAHPLRRVGEPQQVAVRHALALAVLDRLVGERVDRLRRRTSGRPRAAASGPSRGSPRRTSRTGTGACPCGTTCGSASSAALRVALVAEARRHREREQRRVVLRRAALRR